MVPRHETEAASGAFEGARQIALWVRIVGPNEYLNDVLATEIDKRRHLPSLLCLDSTADQREAFHAHIGNLRCEVELSGEPGFHRVPVRRAHVGKATLANSSHIGSNDRSVRGHPLPVHAGGVCQSGCQQTCDDQARHGSKPRFFPESQPTCDGFGGEDSRCMMCRRRRPFNRGQCLPKALPKIGGGSMASQRGTKGLTRRAGTRERDRACTARPQVYNKRRLSLRIELVVDEDCGE